MTSNAFIFNWEGKKSNGGSGKFSLCVTQSQQMDKIGNDQGVLLKKIVKDFNKTFS